MKIKLSATVEKEVLDKIKEIQEESYAYAGFNWSQMIEYVLRNGISALDKKRDLSVDPF